MASCSNKNYNGPERRVVDRREQCDLHFGLEQSYRDLKDLHYETGKKLDILAASLESKVPMKLFYTMIGLVVLILAFQWTTYERLNAVSLRNQEVSAEIKVNLKEITTSVAGRRELYKLEIDQLTKSIEDHQKKSNCEIAEIKNGIKDVKKDISELKQRIKTGGEGK
jgi:hypothetical protein